MKMRQPATKAEFDAVLAAAGDRAVVVYFTATWCVPCRTIAPFFEALAAEFPWCEFIKVDVDQNHETAQACEISVMPMVKVFRQGEEVGMALGANPESLRQLVTTHAGPNSAAARDKVAAMAESPKPAPPIRPRYYVLLISGTMNPPHLGHVRLGLIAAKHLRASGHTVTAICYLPVHDNYLCNKVLLKRKATASPDLADTMAFSMGERCAALKALLKSEPAEETKLCHVLDYECTSGDASLLQASPGYWAPKLPEGYLKTVPTTAVIAHFAAHSPLLVPGARLGLVFGVDNLAGMASWNNPGELFAHRADLVLVARAMAMVKMSSDPSELLRTLKYLDIRAAVPVFRGDTELLGGTVGTYENPGATGDGALFVLPPLEGEDEILSSTSLREAIAARIASDAAAVAPASKRASKRLKSVAGPQLDVGRSSPPEALFARHGYPASSIEALLKTATDGEYAVRTMIAVGKERGEWIVGRATTLDGSSTLVR